MGRRRPSGISVDGDLTINGGTITGTDQTIALAGDWVNNVGASGYDGSGGSSTGTVNLLDATSPSQLIGATTFQNLTITGTGATNQGKVVQLESGVTQTVAGNLTITGETYGFGEIAYVSFGSTVSGVQASIDVAGTDTVTYAAIQDSNAITALAASNSLDLGNNTNWTIGGPSADIWEGDISTDWFDGGNWQSGSVPSGTMTAVIPGDAVRMPVFTANYTAGSVTIVIGAGATMDVQAYRLDTVA